MADAGQRLWALCARLNAEIRAYRRRSHDAECEHWTDHLAFRDQMAAGGYVEWASVAPPMTDDPVECRRFEWPQSWIVRPAQTPPWMNVVGLYWRSHGPTIDGEAGKSDNQVKSITG